MKIRALRVRETGCLREPVALEGLSGGLDVLAGPNELGKSTLFRALEAAFSSLHTSKAASVREWMVPDTGGAPVIEVDFETGGARYRLRKQFFSAPKASLLGLDDGSAARGADAEAKLSELLAKAGGADRLGLLWVHQTGPLEDFNIEPQTAAGLKGLIERELSAAAGGTRVHAVRERVRERLGLLVTPGRRQPRGALRDAIDRQALLASELENLRRKSADGQAALERLAVLREKHADLSASAAKAQRTERVGEARAALEVARAAGLSRRAAEETSKRLLQDHAAATAALEAFDARAGDLVTLAGELEGLASSQQATRAGREGLIVRLDTSATEMAAHASSEHTLRERLENARQAEAAAVQRAALGKRLTGARELSASVANLGAQLAANKATPALLQRAEAASRIVEAASARSARIAIAYERGAAGRIILDGKPIATDGEFEITAPAELVIAGIGRIRFSPPGAAADDAARLTGARHELASILRESGASSIDALRAQASRNATLARDLNAAAARLEGLCPEGLETLQAAIDDLGISPPADEPPAPLATALAKMQENRATAEAAHRAALAAVQQADVTLARLEARIAAARQRLAEVQASHPPSDHRTILAVACSEAAGQSQQALLELSAHRATEPSPDYIAALQRELTAATAAEADAAAKVQTFASEMAGLDASLRRDAIDGIGERLAECEGELGAASKRVDALNREASALALLDQLFDDVATGTSARYLAPVTERLQPYLETLLPGAGLVLGEGFAPGSMLRNGRAEKLVRLSEGTREQVAVLVRLGLARLLADTGEAMPLILDDALVYSDDDRIAAAFAALAIAARHHQVIVLTCRSKAFEPLGGTRLALKPWQGFAE